MDTITGNLSSNTGSVTGSLTTNGSMSGTLSAVVSDHTILTGRDAPNQHPITSVTNLEPALSVLPSEAMTNADIQAIMST